MFVKRKVQETSQMLLHKTVVPHHIVISESPYFRDVRQFSEFLNSTQKKLKHRCITCKSVWNITAAFSCPHSQTMRDAICIAQHLDLDSRSSSGDGSIFFNMILNAAFKDNDIKLSPEYLCRGLLY